jgi:hypothetical protein
MAGKKTSHRWRDLREKKLMPPQLEQLARDAERQDFLEGLAGDFAALRNNPETWQEEEKERAEWDMTLVDDWEDG